MRRLLTYWSKAINGKIAAALLLASVSVVLSWYIAQGVFSRTLTTIDEISAPDKKIRLISDIFRSVVVVQQKQRELILNRSITAREAVQSETRHVNNQLDTLLALVAGDSSQMQQVSLMKDLLTERERLVLQYIGIRSAIINEKGVAEQLQALSTLLPSRTLLDSNVVTTEKKITTSLVPEADSVADTPEKKENSFWRRLFGRSKTVKSANLAKVIREELEVRVDTLSIAEQRNFIQDLELFIDSLQALHSVRTSSFVDREMALVHAGNEIMNRLFDLLHQIEAKEVAYRDASNREAASTVAVGLGYLKGILITCLTLTAVLGAFIFLDLSRSSRYRRQLQAARDEAERLGRVKQRFLANMSHEIRTPLQAVIGFVEQLRLQPAPDRRMLETVHQSSAHLLQIVNEVLDYSRIVSGKFIIESQPFNLAAVFNEVSDAIALQAQHKSLSFERFISTPTHIHVVGDAFRLRQVLYNVLGNAVKYTNHGSVKFEVQHTLKDSYCEILMTVTDTGIGISEADLQRIFVDFERVNENEGRGSGLGLSIVKELVDQQGGAIDVASTPGKGSAFTIRMTYALTAEVNTSETNTSHQLPSVPGTIVIVDDDAFILELCKTIFTRHRVACRTYNNPRELLDAPPDDVTLYLIDVWMPGMNGIELSKRLRERFGSRTKIVALTAQALADERLSLTGSGFDEILVKPFFEKDLLELTNRMLSPTGVKLDLTAIKKMSFDEEAFRQNLDAFVEETTKDRDYLQATPLNKNTRDEVALVIHRLAGRAGQAGATELAAMLRKIETSLRRGEDPTPYANDVQRACERISELVDAILVSHSS